MVVEVSMLEAKDALAKFVLFYCVKAIFNNINAIN